MLLQRQTIKTMKFSVLPFLRLGISWELKMFRLDDPNALAELETPNTKHEYESIANNIFTKFIEIEKNSNSWTMIVEEDESSLWKRPDSTIGVDFIKTEGWVPGSMSSVLEVLKWTFPQRKQWEPDVITMKTIKGAIFDVSLLTCSDSKRSGSGISSLCFPRRFCG